MSTSYFSHLNTQLNESRNTLSAINSIREYISSRVNDVCEFLNTELTNAKISITDPTNISGTFVKVGYLTKQQYDEAVTNNQPAQVVYDSEGHYFEISADQIASTVEDELSTLRAQDCFLEYCLSNTETVTASDFIMKARAKLGEIAPSYIERFSNFIGAANSAVGALQSFFQSEETEITTNEYNGISIVNGNNYEGSVFVSAISQIGSDIASIFHDIVESVKEIGSVVGAIVAGLEKFAKWVFSKLFKDLGTNFVPVNDTPYGVIDLPLLQIKFSAAVNDTDLGDHTLSYWMQQLILATETQIGSPYHGCTGISSNVIFDYSSDSVVTGFTAETALSLFMSAAFRSCINRLKYSDDGVKLESYNTGIDIPLPGGPYDFIIRIGSTEAQAIASSHIGGTPGVWQLLVCLPNSEVYNISDQDIHKNIYASLVNACKRLGDIIPFFSSENQQWHNTYANIACSCVMKDPNSSAASSMDLYQLLTSNNRPGFNCTIAELMTWINQDTTYNNYYASFIFALWYYTAFCAPLRTHQYKETISNLSCSMQFLCGEGTSSVFNNTFESCINTIYGAYKINPNPSGSDPSYVAFDSIDINLDTLSINTYMPYAKEFLTPASVHFQTTAERAAEVKKVIYGTVIAIAAIVVAIKTAKWIRGRKIKAQLAEAAMDASSWEYAANPSITNYETFVAKRKSFRHVNRVNAILGLTSGSQSVYNALGSGIDYTQKVLTDSSNNTSENLNTLINKVNSVISSCNDIKLLIAGPDINQSRKRL